MEHLHKLSQWRIAAKPVGPDTTLAELVDGAFMAYNSGRLREGCHLFAEKMLGDDVVVGLSVSGALIPAGIGQSCLIPLMEAGFIDWLVSTGANLYHDTHFALDMELHQIGATWNDLELKKHKVIRIYDVVFDASVLIDTDEFYRQLLHSEPFQRRMGTAELHWLIGKYLAARDEQLGRPSTSVLACAYLMGIPVYTPAPGDSTIGLVGAAIAMDESKFALDPWLDVNETSAIVYGAQQQGQSAVVMLGGGTPKNFLLQTEPQIQDILGLPGRGHDYFLQLTDARPDTGGLSGATPSEAMTWGKVDPKKLPDSVTCYVDSTIGFPILAAYALANRAKRTPRRLYEQRETLLRELRAQYHKRRDKRFQQRKEMKKPAKQI